MRSVSLMALMMFSTGCGPGFLVLEAGYPTEPQTLEPDSGIKVFIGEVTDDREFDMEAETLSVPSFWDAPAFKDREYVVGAKSSSGGKNLQNIYLEDGQTVESIVADMLGVAFRQAGYRIVKDEDKADLVVEASLKELWLWMTPGGMTIRIVSRIQADVTVTGEGGTKEMEAGGNHDSPDVTQTPDSYRFALQESLWAFYADLATQAINLEMPEAPPEP
jgi:hypothetical protein